MLSVKEVEQLLAILEEEKSFDVIAQGFHRAFPKHEQFNAATALAVFLQDNMLSPTKRLQAFYVLHDLYKAEPPAGNPFLPVFIDAIKADTSLCERTFVINLLCYSPRDVLTCLPLAFVPMTPHHSHCAHCRTNMSRPFPVVAHGQTLMLHLVAHSYPSGTRRS